jgi:hypothetical protein
MDRESLLSDRRLSELSLSFRKVGNNKGVYMGISSSLMNPVKDSDNASAASVASIPPEPTEWSERGSGLADRTGGGGEMGRLKD